MKQVFRSIAKELNNRVDGNRNDCVVCNLAHREGKISMDELWHRSLDNVPYTVKVDS